MQQLTAAVSSAGLTRRMKEAAPADIEASWPDAMHDQGAGGKSGSWVMQEMVGGCGCSGDGLKGDVVTLLQGYPPSSCSSLLTWTQPVSGSSAVSSAIAAPRCRMTPLSDDSAAPCA